jgi:hypothetical protein
VSSALHWRTPLCISKRAELDVIVADVEMEISNKDVYWQKQVLIDSLETWLLMGKEVPCANLSCPEYL